MAPTVNDASHVAAALIHDGVDGGHQLDAVDHARGEGLLGHNAGGVDEGDASDRG